MSFKTRSAKRQIRKNQKKRAAAETAVSAVLRAHRNHTARIGMHASSPGVPDHAGTAPGGELDDAPRVATDGSPTIATATAADREPGSPAGCHRNERACQQPASPDDPTDLDADAELHRLRAKFGEDGP